MMNPILSALGFKPEMIDQAVGRFQQVAEALETLLKQQHVLLQGMVFLNRKMDLLMKELEVEQVHSESEGGGAWKRQ